jgi:hypothetical protein
MSIIHALCQTTRALYATRQLVIAHLQNFARGAKVLLKISPRAQ